MAMLKEFKEFAMKGSVVDLAVGVIIGAAFGKIVTSLVEDIVMPLLTPLTGKIQWENKFYSMAGSTATNLADAKKDGAAIAYGLFVQNIVQFIIMAFAIFLMVKVMNKARKPEPEAAPAAPAEDVVLLTEIRDLLKSK
ncbi:MAG TPA: large conductance mechanosensitive channel protein MscL [Fimbriimonadaceae bacterium]|nr:large conductance mechanosensitive channel protein MscL [Fimbriimonadaceae bacterium]